MVSVVRVFIIACEGRVFELFRGLVLMFSELNINVYIFINNLIINIFSLQKPNFKKMAFNTKLADEVRAYLADFDQLSINEKRMFGGLAFMVNQKMCVNVSGDRLMCRFNPEREKEITKKPGYEPMIMKGKELKGYCFVNPDGIKSQANLKFWIDLCLEFNEVAKRSSSKSH